MKNLNKKNHAKKLEQIFCPKQFFAKNAKSLAVKLSFLIFTLFAFFSCYNPSPLYGTWSDNLGNQIQFNDDGTFSVTVTLDDGTEDAQSGMYIVAENVLQFSLQNETRFVTEWDIRGSILYLIWTSTVTGEIKEQNLSLYHN